jgi:putative transposase
LFPRFGEERKPTEASKFCGAQQAFVLKQGADGVPLAEICRRSGISQASYFNWKKKYEGLTPPEMRRLNLLEEGNAKLKKLVADLSMQLRSDRSLAGLSNDLCTMDFAHDQLATGQKGAPADDRQYVQPLLPRARCAVPPPRGGRRGNARAGCAWKSATRTRSRSSKERSSSVASSTYRLTRRALNRTSRARESRRATSLSRRSTVRFRAEYLNQHWFLTLADAREKVEAWRSNYNTERPYSAVGNILPADFASSATPRCNGAGCCAYSGALRPTPLHHRARKAQMMNGFYSDLGDRTGLRQELNKIGQVPYE